MFLGLRLSEFLQLKENAERGLLQTNLDGLPQAFILADVSFFGPRKEILHVDHTSAAHYDKISGFSIRWRYQKNLQNGETKMLVRNTRTPALCPVRAMLRICHRVVMLRVPSSWPLAVYQSSRGPCCLLNHKQMETLIKQAAKAVYKLTPKNLQKFSVHSLRVGACVMLHVAGFSADDIKFELRWRSDAFRDYLRNVLSTATAKTRSLQDFDPDDIPF